MYKRQPCSDAVAEVNISGAEVPKATIVSPMISGETPRLRAVVDAPSTNLSALQMRPANPKTI